MVGHTSGGACFLLTFVMCLRFQEILKEQGYKGYKNGEPISREFFDEHITGGHNSLLSAFLWPERSQAEQDIFSDEKEARFRELSGTLRLVQAFGFF